MWKDKIKGIFQDVRRGVEEVCEDVKEKVEKAELGEKLKKVGEDIKEGVEKAEIGDKLKKFGEDIKEQFVPNGQGTSASDESTVVYETTAVVSDVEEKETTEKTAEIDVADEECALTVPTEDGPRGEFTCLNEKTYSFLIPKEEGFVDEGNCHAAEIHQAYGFGREINYEYDAMFCFSIAGEFDCEIKESGVKAAYSRYDSAPTRSKLMEIEHPLFTHAYLFDTPKKYRITYLKQLGEYELLGCELILRKSGGDEAWKTKMIEEFKRFAGSCREV